MAQARATTNDRGGTTFVLLASWLLSYFGIRLWLEANANVDTALRLALSFVPAPLFALFMWRFIRGLRAADEMERRIQLESLAVAFPLGLLLLTTLGLVQRAVTLNFEDWSYNHVWPMFVLFYFIGLAVARRRYT